MAEAFPPPPRRAGDALRERRLRALRSTGRWTARITVVAVVFFFVLPLGWAVVIGAGGATIGIVAGRPNIQVFGLRRMDAPRYDPLSGVRYDDQGCVIGVTDGVSSGLHNWLTRRAVALGLADGRAHQMRTWDAAQNLLASDVARTLGPGGAVELGRGAAVRCDGEMLVLDRGAGRVRRLGDTYAGANPECDDITVALDPDAAILLVDVSCPDGRHGYGGAVHSYDIASGECIQWISD